MPTHQQRHIHMLYVRHAAALVTSGPPPIHHLVCHFAV